MHTAHHTLAPPLLAAAGRDRQLHSGLGGRKHELAVSRTPLERLASGSCRVVFRLLAAVRGVPLLGGPLPAPQAVAWGEVATYRVELRAVTDAPCGAATCYEALLLDGAP